MLKVLINPLLMSTLCNRYHPSGRRSCDGRVFVLGPLPSRETWVRALVLRFVCLFLSSPDPVLHKVQQDPEQRRLQRFEKPQSLDVDSLAPQIKITPMSDLESDTDSPLPCAPSGMDFLRWQSRNEKIIKLLL